MMEDIRDEIRQPLQVIRTQADNIIHRLKQLGIEDEIIIESQQAIDRAVVRIDDRLTYAKGGTLKPRPPLLIGE